MRFVRVGRVELAQPALVVIRPVVEVVRGRLREGVFALGLAQVEQPVLQAGLQVGLAQAALVGLDKDLIQKADRQRRMVRLQQFPGRVMAAQLGGSVVIQGAS